ncbi:MAG: hypothetical protein MHPSP_003672, partial [Paramarteilia canceri]
YIILNIQCSEDDQNGIFDYYIYHYHYFNGSQDIKGNYCPIGSIISKNGNQESCLTCNDGTSSSSKNANICNECLPNFEKIQPEHSNNFICRKCELGSLSLEISSSSHIKKCTQTNCIQTEYFDEITKRCIKCNSNFSNLIGRPLGTPPLIKYCACPNNSIKIELEKGSFSCLHNEDNFVVIYRAKQKIANLEIKQGLHFIRWGKETIDINIRYCNAYDRPLLEEYACCCNRGFLFYDGKCQSCRIIQNKINQRVVECFCLEGHELIGTNCMPCRSGYFKNSKEVEYCSQCQQNAISSPDKTECLCFEGYELIYSKCVPCSKSYFKDKAGNEKCKECQQNAISSPDKTECLCSEGYELIYSKCVPCSKSYFKDKAGNEKCEK